MKREVANWIVQLTPWEMRIKKIESKLVFYAVISWLECCWICRSIWFCCRFILYFPSMGLLDQHFYQHLYLRFSHGSRGSSLLHCVLKLNLRVTLNRFFEDTMTRQEWGKKLRTRSQHWPCSPYGTSRYNFFLKQLSPSFTTFQNMLLYVPLIHSFIDSSCNRDTWNSLLYFTATTVVKKQRKLVSNDGNESCFARNDIERKTCL